ncbi:MAG: hypothetical protein QM718_06310 [Steroidobacteraceae bacterium]
MLQFTTFRRLLAIGIVAGTSCIGAAPVWADRINPASIKPGDVGPVTPYGETAAEAARKKLMFDWLYMVMIQRKPQQAFEKYVSRDYCNHGHLSTQGKRDCSDYNETLARWVKNYARPLNPGEQIEMPRLATVNGEMVTMYGEGVDIFRVHDGKITDHWDASPPAEVTIKAHAPGFAEWVMGGMQGPMPMTEAQKAAMPATGTPAPAADRR